METMYVPPLVSIDVGVVLMLSVTALTECFHPVSQLVCASWS